LILIQINGTRKLSTPVFLFDTLIVAFKNASFHLSFLFYRISIMPLFIISLSHYRINPLPIKIVAVPLIYFYWI